jgi:hypothetical protein|tara:strand:- start:998 stop:1198 length:201 start_codon:yes stop_codon:yes gene_type:complete
MKTAKEKNQEINNIQKEKNGMGANDKLYNDSMSKDAEREAVTPNTKISRFKIEGIMPLVETKKARN